MPTFEWIVDKKVIEKLTPGKTYEQFCYEMELDAICVECDYTKKYITDNLIEDEWRMIKKDSGQAHLFPVDGPIRTMADVEAYIPPDPKTPERYKSIERAVAEHSGNKAVVLHLNDVFSIPSRLMPFNDFMIMLYTNPDVVKALVDMSVDINLKMAEQAVKRGIKIVYTGDDYAYNAGPMMSPAHFDEFFAPGLKRVIHGYKDLGLWVIKHTDGNILPIINQIVDSGIDCLDPIDPLAGMDLAKIKKDYGSRISIKGNVDCAHTLTFKSLQETIEETKHCLEIGMPGGMYFISSSNSIHSEVKPENYNAMLETIREFGKY